MEKGICMECVTFTQLVQLGEANIMRLRAHILPCQTTPQPYSWFADKQNQELLALTYDTVLKLFSPELNSSLKPGLHLKRGRDLRVLFMLKPTEYRQHILIPEPGGGGECTGLIPRVAFISDKGKKVLPFLNQRTQGSGYKSSRLTESSVEAHVDHYTLSDPRGVLKVMARLNSSLSLLPQDISNLQLPLPSDPALDNICDFAEIPVMGLNSRKRKEIVSRKTVTKNKKVRVSSKSSLAHQPTPTHQPTLAKQPTSTHQPTLAKQPTSTHQPITLAKQPTSTHQPITLAGQDSPSHQPTLKEVLDRKSNCSHVDLSEKEMKEFCDFDSTIYLDKTPPLSPTLDNTPPLGGAMGQLLGGAGNGSSRSMLVEDDEGGAHYSSSDTFDYDDISTPDYITPNTTSRDSCDQINPNTTTSQDSCDQINPITTSQDSCDQINPITTSQDSCDQINPITTSQDSCRPNTTTSQDSCRHINPAVVDLTELEDDVISIESSEEEENVNGSIKKRKKLKDTKEILKGANSVSEVKLSQIKNWIYFRKPLLVDIFKRLTFSRRHEDFVSGSHKKRDALKYQIDYGMFGSEKVKVITDLLLHIFCGRHMKFFGYVMSVLLPECLIRIVGDVHDVSFEEAERKIMNYQSPSSSTDDSDYDTP